MTNLLKILIKENIKSIMNENFIGKSVIEDLKAIMDPEEAHEIAEHYKLKKLGEGSSRTTYRISTEKVLKISGGDRSDYNIGFAQNETEVSVYTNPETKELVPKIYDYHHDFFWIISERVIPFKSPVEFYNEIGIDSSFLKKFLEKFIEYGHEHGYEEILSNVQAASNNNSLYWKNYIKNFNNIFKKEGKEKEFFYKILNLLEVNFLSYGEISYSHFGKTADGRIVFYDTGYDDEVGQNFYRKEE